MTKKIEPGEILKDVPESEIKRFEEAVRRELCDHIWDASNGRCRICGAKDEDYNSQ